MAARREVAFAPEAVDDLRKLYDFIAERSGETRALAQIERIEAYCRAFADFPERGTRRDDILPGLRVVGFEGRVTIAFDVGAGVVTILRVAYGGRGIGLSVDTR